MNSIASAGLVLGSRFLLERRIAVGGMGQVWKSTDQVLERPVAVKILRPELTDSDEFLTRFRTEARLAAGVSHPGIAHVYDYGEDEFDGQRVAFLVMEYVDGEALSALLARGAVDHPLEHPLEHPVELGRIVSILWQTAEALGKAHEFGIVHRDIKPGNLMITADARVKVTDFGIARAINGAAITAIGDVVGTVRYMSPEQALGEEATPASDVYSLGVVGYEMLAGRAPFTADSQAAIALAHVQTPPPALPASVPDGLRSLIERSLAKRPEDRPADGVDFAAALRDVPIVPSDATPTALVAARSSSHPAPTVVMHPTAVLRQPMMRDGGVLGTEDDASTEIGTSFGPPSATPLLGGGWVDAQRRRRRIAGWSAAAALVACVLVVVAFSRSGDVLDASVSGSIVSDTTVESSAVAALVTIDPASFHGITEEEARTALAAAGLTATTTASASTSVLAGLVIDVQPSGPVAAGSNVTIVLGDGTVAPVAEPPPAENPDNGNGKPDKDAGGSEKDKNKGRGNGRD